MNTFYNITKKLRICCIWIAILEVILFILMVSIAKWTILTFLTLAMVYYFFLLNQYLNLSQPYRTKLYKNLLKVFLIVFILQYAYMLHFIIFFNAERIISPILTMVYYNISITAWYGIIAFLLCAFGILFFILFFRYKILLYRIMRNTKKANGLQMIKWTKIFIIFLLFFTALSIKRQILDFNYYVIMDVFIFKLIVDILLFLLLVLCLVQFKWLGKLKLFFYSLIYTSYISIIFNMSYLYMYYSDFSYTTIKIGIFTIFNILTLIQLIRLRIGSECTANPA